MAVLSRRTATAPARRSTKDALVTAVIELLGEGHAYADISIEQLVRRAGLSRPTFYSYFDDKRDLILQLGAELQDAVAVAADPWLTQGEGEVRDTLTAVLETFRRHRETTAALTEAATYDTEVNAFWRAFHERFMRIAAARIRTADPGLPRPRSEARAFALVWMTERTLTEHLANPGIDETALIEELAGFWEQSLASGPDG